MPFAFLNYAAWGFLSGAQLFGPIIRYACPTTIKRLLLSPKLGSGWICLDKLDMIS
jgi:hypothetical protein